MKRTYQIVALCFLMFSAFMGRESLALNYWTRLGPGPAFFPFWLSALIGSLALVMLYQATFQGSDPMPEDFYPSKVGYVRIGAVVLAVVWCVLMLERLGFRTSTLAFLLFLLSALGRVHIVTTVLVAAAGSLGTYHLFVELLKVPLPQGPLGY